MAYNCEFEKSFDYFQEVIDLNMAAKNHWGAAAIKGNLAHCCSWLWGKCDLGFRISREAVQFGRGKRRYPTLKELPMVVMGILVLLKDIWMRRKNIS